jgi:hypothetical protein
LSSNGEITAQKNSELHVSPSWSFPNSVTSDFEKFQAPKSVTH